MNTAIRKPVYQGVIDPRSATKVGRIQNALRDLAADLVPNGDCQVVAYVVEGKVDLLLYKLEKLTPDEQRQAIIDRVFRDE